MRGRLPAGSHDTQAASTPSSPLTLRASTLDLFGMALVRHERGQPERCPQCGSYRLVGDYRSELDAYVTLCEACEWESAARAD
jgi:hypothetical protein